MDIKKALLLIFILSIVCRIFTFIVLPEEAYTDSIYHLGAAEQIISSGSIPSGGDFGIIAFQPVDYLLNSAFFIVFGSKLALPFIRLFPLLLMGISIAFMYLLSKKLFKDNYIIPLAYAAVIPWVIRYSPVNYLENLSLVLVLALTYLFAKAYYDSSRASIVLIPFVFLALLFSKITMFALLPLFLLSIIFIGKFPNARDKFEIKKNIPRIALFLVILLIAAMAFFIVVSNTSFGNSAFGNSLAIFAEKISGAPGYAYNYFLAFYDFPLAQYFDKIPAALPPDIIRALLALMILPVFAATVWGFRKTDLFQKAILAAFILMIFLSFLMDFATDPRDTTSIRYLLPLMPLLGIFFAKGFLSIQRRALKSLVMISFILFSAYGISYSAYSAYHYNQELSKYMGAYEFVGSLDGGARIYSLPRYARYISFNTNAYAECRDCADVFANQQLLYPIAKSNGFTHIMQGCYGEFFNENELLRLESDGRITEIYSDGCSTIYKIN